MSKLPQIENLKQIVQKTQVDFDKMAKIHGAVNYEREASFALQALSNNDFLANTAFNNQDSLKMAVINVAAIGLTLSPVFKMAYLVPRDKKVILDISYLGYIQLGIDCGAIKWAHADVVYENDTFELNGLGREPTHKFKPFGKERGAIVGAYCTVKTHDEEYLNTIMTIEDIYAIRNRSQSYKSGGMSPWKSDETEMIKKTVVRRSYKSWPKSSTRASDSRFERAIEISNETDPVEYNALPAPAEASVNDIKYEAIRHALVELNRSEEQYIAHLKTVNRRDIKAITDLTDLELDAALIQLNQWLELDKAKKAALEAKKEESNEIITAN